MAPTSKKQESQQRVGVILIGRNEGERLIRALDAVASVQGAVVYVDSASTDGSCEAARARNVEVVELDMSIPFTAARARNAGFERLLEIAPSVEYVQFIDGDCEIESGWLEEAAKVLDERPEVAAVCGFRRERFPERTWFNRVCDVEWSSGPTGYISCFGGDVMIRARALRAIGGYDATLIAGEDEEVGIRLRHAGGKLLRIDKISTWHDADMHKVQQWWRRAKRCGHAYAQLHHLYGAPPERKAARELRRTVVWGAVVPLAAVGLSLPTLGSSLLLLGAYPLRATRVVARTRKEGYPWQHAIAWGLSCAVAPLPEALGAARFHLNQRLGRQSRLIEYKGPQS